MNKNRVINVSFPIFSVIIGISIISLFVIDRSLILWDQFGNGFGFFSLFYISPIGLVLGLIGLMNKKKRYIALLGIGINLSIMLYCFLILTVFYTP